jgi:hypothetical protein
VYLQRNQTPSLVKAPTREGVAVRRVQAKQLINPYGKITTPHLVVSLLQSLHTQKNLQLNREFYTYFKEARVFLDIYGPEKVERVLMLSAQYSRYPWGFPFLNKLAKEDRRENKEEKKKMEAMSSINKMIHECYG